MMTILSKIWVLPIAAALVICARLPVAAADTPLQTCDRLTSSEIDDLRVAPVVSQIEDFPAAIAACRAAVAQNQDVPRAKVNLARALFEAGHMRRNDEAETLLRDAAKAGYAAAYLDLAMYLNESAGRHPLDPDQFEIIRKAADLGNSMAEGIVGGYLLRRDRTGESRASALRYLQSAAEKNERNAAYTLASVLINDPKQPDDQKKGLMWLHRAAALKNRHAIGRLGEFYLGGFLVDEDTERGLALIEKAALMGLDKYKLMLAQHYYMRRGLAHEGDARELFRFWLCEAGEEGRLMLKSLNEGDCPN